MRVVILLGFSLIGCGGGGAGGGEDGGGPTDGAGDTGRDAWQCATDASCAVGGAVLVEGAGLVVQDVSDDGTTLAYADASKVLFVVPTDGGSPQQIATGVDSARYKGNRLAIFQGVDASGIAATMLVLAAGTTTPVEAGSQVVVASVYASADGDHYVFVAKQTAGGTTEDVVLDGTTVVSGATKERARFSPSSNDLVVSSTVSAVKKLQSFPLAGGPPVTLAASGAAKRFSITPDGGTVVFGANDNGSLADLTKIPIGGGGTTVLVPGGARRAFRVLEDGSTLAFLSSSSALATIGMDGTGQAPLVGSGVVDIIQTSSQQIVYATFVDGTTGLATLRIVGKTGTADTALGTDALDEGFAPGEGYYVFRDNVVGTSGRLRSIAPGGSVSTLGDSVTKSSFVDAARVVFLDSGYALRKASLASGVVEVLEDGVGSFNDVPDGLGLDSSRVALAVPSGSNAGIYVAPIGTGP